MTQPPAPAPPEPKLPAQSLSRWDNEGGAMDADAATLPDGITTRIVREYIVGPYRYTDPAQALAEHTRQLARKAQ